tara:strand:- start:700 stop:975 length:276 start_codon:yes stop_codon:yes gene_type:complete
MALLLAPLLYRSSIIPLFASFQLRAISPFTRALRHRAMYKQQDLEINQSVLQVYFLYAYFIIHLFCYFLLIFQNQFSLALSFEVQEFLDFL